MKYMISNFLHRIYMDGMPVMPVEYNSSYIGIEYIYAIFLIVEIIAAVMMSIKAICIIVEEKREKILVVKEEGNKTFVKKPIYWIIFAAGCCFILILTYLTLAENRTYHVPYPLRFLVMAFVPFGLFLLNAGILRFIISHLKKDISVNDVIVQILIVLGIILLVFGIILIVLGSIYQHIIYVNPSY